MLSTIIVSPALFYGLGLLLLGAVIWLSDGLRAVFATIRSKIDSGKPQTHAKLSEDALSAACNTIEDNYLRLKMQLEASQIENLRLKHEIEKILESFAGVS